MEYLFFLQNHKVKYSYYNNRALGSRKLEMPFNKRDAKKVSKYELEIGFTLATYSV